MGGKSSGPSKAQIMAQRRAEQQRKLLEQQTANRQAEVDRKQQSRATLAKRRGLGRASLTSGSETGVQSSGTLGNSETA